MSTSFNLQRDSSERSVFASGSVSCLAEVGRLDRLDAAQPMELGDQADWTLLRLVMCAAAATLGLALATSLVG